MHYRLVALFIGFVALGVLHFSVREAARRIVPSVTYELWVEFAEMPPNDAALVEWLRNEPGVHRRATFVDRQQNTIRITLRMSRDLTGYPPRPDFLKNFDRLGYSGLTRYEPR